MKNEPLISVITPTLNSANFIEANLLSVARQNYNNIEHIVIDGLSSDGTLDIIGKYQDHYAHIKLKSEKDSGIYDAMNKGVDIAKGDWLYFLGSDDTLYDENVFSSLKDILADPGIDIVYGNVIFKTSGQKYNGKYNKTKLLQKNICHQAILTRKTVFSKLGKFNVNYKALADWHFNMKWFNDKRIKRFYTESIIAYYFEGGYCFSNPNNKFYLDWNFNTIKYFSGTFMTIYKQRSRVLARLFLKIFWNE